VSMPRPAGLSVRVKLALSYAGLVVVAGVALFAVGLLLLRYVPDGNLWLSEGGYAPNRSDLLEVFVKYAWWAIGALVVFGLVGGWLLAGVVLRPLDRITAVARLARDGALDQRIDLPGPRDELTDLADAFDAMLARVQRTLDEERRFAANASHELRTPHTIIRTLVEVGEADRDGRDVDTLLRRIGATNDRAIAITESLLALARGGVRETEPVDLAELVAEAVSRTRRMPRPAASGSGSSSIRSSSGATAPSSVAWPRTSSATRWCTTSTAAWWMSRSRTTGGASCSSCATPARRSTRRSGRRSSSRSCAVRAAPAPRTAPPDRDSASRSSPPSCAHTTAISR
jgi:HAMP domain-containing protein